MTDRSHSRVALDLDALETGIAGGDSHTGSTQGAAGQPPKDAAPQGAATQASAGGGGASEDARLAELARIVGQNDRFRDLLRTPLDDGRASAHAAAQAEQWQAHAQAPVSDQDYYPEMAGAGDAAAHGDPARLHAWMSDPATGAQQAGYTGHAGYQDDFQDGFHDQNSHGQGAYDHSVQGQGIHGQPLAGHQDQYAGAGDAWEAAAPADYAGRSHDAAPQSTQGYGHQEHSQAWDAAPVVGHYGSAPGGFAPGLDPLAALEGARLRNRRPSRRPLYAAVAVVALCVAASAGYFGLRGGAGDNGEAPMIRADASPVRVKPQVENAAEPAATKEIYEQIARAPGETRVVAHNEQPVDVEQTLRQQRAAAMAAGRLPSEVDEQNVTFGAPGVPPLPTHAANRDPRAGLGEPRRVRTVSIGPDGKVRETAQAAASQGVASPATAAPAPARTAPQVAKQEHRVPSTMVDDTPTGSVNAAAPAPRAAPSAAATAPVAAAARGKYAVQLGAPGSEKEAKTLAASLKRKYPTLSGHGTAVIKAQSNGRTIYRLRVPGLSREAATGLCQQLKAAGGNCFVAQG